MTYAQWTVSAILGAVGLFSVVMTTSKPQSNVIQSLDPKMCDHLCNHRIGCSEYLYRNLDLSCQLTLAESRSGYLFLEGADNYKIFKACCMNENIIEEDTVPDLIRKLFSYNGVNPLLCLYHGSSHVTIYSSAPFNLRKERQHTRILMLPHFSSLRNGRQLFLQNRSVVMFSNISIPRVISIAYISVTKTLVLASTYPDRLFLVPLDNEDETIIIKVNSTVAALYVDDANQLVFLTAYYKRKIQVMTTQGRNVKGIINLQWRPRGIVADSKRRVIYVVRKHRLIVKYTYKGEAQGPVARGLICSSLCLDSERDVLYYMKRTPKVTLFKLFLSNSSSHIIPVPFQPLSSRFYVFFHNLYITPSYKRTTLAVLSENGEEITTFNSGYQIVKGALHLCTLP